MSTNEYLVEFGCVEDHPGVREYLRENGLSYSDADEAWIVEGTQSGRAANGIYLAIRTDSKGELTDHLSGNKWDYKIRAERPAKTYPAR